MRTLVIRVLGKLRRDWRSWLWWLPALPYRSSHLRVHSTAARLAWLYQSARTGSLGAQVPDCPVVDVKIDESIPQLAWLCSVDGERYDVTVGRSVERSEAGVFEGVWDGPFEDWAPHEADVVMGSGVIFDGPATFVTAKHPHEQLFVVRVGTTAYVSNSLAFAMKSAGVSVESDFAELVARCLREKTDRATKVGVDAYRPLVARLGEFELYRIFFQNFRVAVDGRVQTIFRAPISPFATFREYKRYLVVAMQRLFENGRAQGRSTRFEPLTTVSSGYDSAAASALGKHLGLADAITLDVTVNGHNDSGAEVGAALGLRVTPFTHVAGVSVDSLQIELDQTMQSSMAEFLATAGLGDDMTYAPFGPVLEGRLLLTGVYGDAAWGTLRRLRSGLPIGIPFGKSLSEFRLRAGFAHVPVASIGCRFAPPIVRLNAEPGMEAYRLGGSYDRPIARRIAEEAGVPREIFGQRKAGTAPNPTNWDGLWLPAMKRIYERYP